MKKLLIGVLASTMILSSMAGIVSATEQAEVLQRIETQTLSYPPMDDVIEVGEFLIRPNSTVENTCSFMAYTGTETTLEVPETIGGYTVNEMGRTMILSSADVLYYNDTVKTLRLPDTIIRAQIESWTELTELHLSNQLLYLDGSDMTKLAQVDLPDSLQHIILSNSTSLTSIDFPENIIALGIDSFSGCTSLTEIYIPDSVIYLAGGSFSDCTALSKVRLPETITSINGGLFSRCTSLKELVIPEGVTLIDGAAFNGCSNLETLFVPSTVTRVDVVAFSNCDSLTTLYFGGTEADKENMIIHSIGNDLLDNVNWIFNSTIPEGESATPTTPETEESTTPEPETTFPTYSSWAEPQVTFAEENNLMVDSLGNDYTKSITRAQIADLLVNMMEQYTGTSLESASSDTFTDTTSEAVLKAYEAGIISGKGEGIFDPEATATRQEIAIMIVNAIKVLEENTGESFVDHSLTNLEGFSDFEETSDWAQNHVAILANNNIMTGSDGNLTPLLETSIQECLVLNNNLFKFGE